MSKKRIIALFLVGIILICTIMVGVTYAFLEIEGERSVSETNMGATLEDIASGITLEGGEKNIMLELTYERMKEANKGKVYYGSEEGTKEEYTEITLGEIRPEISGKYSCRYKVEVRQSADSTLYEAFQGMEGKSSEQIVTTIDGVKYDFNESNLFPIEHEGVIEGVESGVDKEIKIDLYVVNRIDKNQNGIIGTKMNLEYEITEFSCTSEDSATEPTTGNKPESGKDEEGPCTTCGTEGIADQVCSNASSMSKPCSRTLARYVADLADDTENTNVTKVLHNSTIQTECYSPVDYRYAGPSSIVNNYVTLDDTLYRIIGVFKMPKIYGTTGSYIASEDDYEWRVKLIMADQYTVEAGSSSWTSSSGKEFYWNASDRSNNWLNSSLNKNILNNTYYNSLSSTTKDLIEPSIWYLGGWNTNSILTSKIYEYERGTTRYNTSTYPLNIISNIGIMYPSDYGYATNGGTCVSNTKLNGYNNATCYQNDWLYLPSTIQWTITQKSDINNNAWDVDRSGYMDNNNVYNSVFAARPVFYLKSNVILSGNHTGSASDPYEITLGSGCSNNSSGNTDTNSNTFGETPITPSAPPVSGTYTVNLCEDANSTHYNTGYYVKLSDGIKYFPGGVQIRNIPAGTEVAYIQTVSTVGSHTTCTKWSDNCKFKADANKTIAACSAGSSCNGTCSSVANTVNY